jgi:hypothetical protein
MEETRLVVDWATVRSDLPVDLEERFVDLTVQYPESEKPDERYRELTFSFRLRVSDDPHGEDITYPLRRFLSEHRISLNYWLDTYAKRGAGGVCSISKYVKHRTEFSSAGVGFLHVTLRT